MKTILARQISLFVTYAPPKNIIIIILKTTNNEICEPNSILKSLSMHKTNSITTGISYTHIQLKHSTTIHLSTAQLIHHATKIISRYIILSRNALHSIIVPLQSQGPSHYAIVLILGFIYVRKGLVISL